MGSNELISVASKLESAPKRMFAEVSVNSGAVTRRTSRLAASSLRVISTDNSPFVEKAVSTPSHTSASRTWRSAVLSATETTRLPREAGFRM